MNIEKIREDFPILSKVIYLDNAASTQKPMQVIEEMRNFYLHHYSNVHRGIYRLSEEATEMYEKARKKIAEFINVKKQEVIFTKNTTESLNLVADTLIRYLLKNRKKVRVLISIKEHHSNIIPWLICKERYKNVELDYVYLDKSNQISVEDFERKLKKCDILSLTGLSNVSGYKTPMSFFKRAKEEGKITIMDGAQLVPHSKIKIKYVDFLAFSSHKMLGPTGIGVLYGRYKILSEIPCFLGGGEMIKEVYENKYIADEIPYKFEAGTMPIAEAIGLRSAIDYINKIGIERIEKYERKLTKYLYEEIEKLKLGRIKIPFKWSENKIGIFSFYHKKIHPHDFSYLLDKYNIATRAGFHCAMPLHNYLNIKSTVRASLYFYNTYEEIDKFVNAVKDIDKKF